MTIPKHKRLIGHEEKRDIYETPNGEIYWYTGNRTKHYINPKYWKKVSSESETNAIPNKNWYVTMTDKFMSNWGRARGKINKVVIGCDNHNQAKTIERNARLRDEMKYINITSRRPYYNTRGYHVSYRDYESLGDIWTR